MTVDIPFFKYYFQLLTTGEIFSIESSFGNIDNVLSGVNVDSRLRHLYKSGGLKLVKDELLCTIPVKLEQVMADITVERTIQLKPAPAKVIVYGDVANSEPTPTTAKTNKKNKKQPKKD